MSPRRNEVKTGEFSKSIQKGLNWLSKRQNNNGSFDPVGQGLGAYQKTALAFIRNGKNEAGNKLLSWIKQNRFNSDGDFSHRTSGYVDDLYPYPNSWLILASQALGRFDISYPGISFLISLQDPNLGGFYLKPSGKEMDILCSSACGIALLFLGKLDKASKVYNFLETIWSEQPEPEKQFYVVYDSKDGLITDMERINPELGAIYYKIDPHKKSDVIGKNQNHFNLGIAAAFLVKYYLSTGDKGALELAKRYVNYGLDCEGIYSSVRACKFGWGSALLYQITGKEKFKEAAVNVWKFIASIQKEDGRWEYPKESDKTYITMDWTSEFVFELSELIIALTSQR